MKHLGEQIIQEGFTENKVLERNAARGIIFNEKKELLFVYSKFYNDVSFPGGGVEPEETIEQALYRECLEEVGAVINSHKEFYKITEKRDSSFSKDNYNVFHSFYYICTYKELVKESLLDYEINLGYETRWMSLEDAINLNSETLEKLINKKKYTGVVQRELRILEELKKII